MEESLPRVWGQVPIRTLDRGQNQLYELDMEDMAMGVLVILWGGVPNSDLTSGQKKRWKRGTMKYTENPHCWVRVPFAGGLITQNRRDLR